MVNNLTIISQNLNLTCVSSKIRYFTTYYPLTFAITSVSLLSLTCVALMFSLFTGVALGIGSAFTVYTGVKHILKNKKDFISLVKISIRILRTNDSEIKNSLERQVHYTKRHILQPKIFF